MGEPKLIHFNVGGRHYEATDATLRRFPGARLARLAQEHDADRDDVVQIFIDRDGDLFKHILAYYREPNNPVLPRNMREIRELLREAHYYQIPKLVDELNSLLKTYPFAVGDVVKFDPMAVQMSWDLNDLHGGQTVLTFQSQSFGPDPKCVNAPVAAASAIRGRIEELNEHVARISVMKRGENRLMRELLESGDDDFQYVDVYVMLGILIKVE